MSPDRRAGWAPVHRPLREQHDVLLLDLDGVVYVGDGVVPRADEALAAARAAGARLCFVTNNASRTARSVADHLTRIGVPAEPDDVVTSAQAAAAVLAEQLPSAARVLVIGGEGLRAAVGAVGLVAVTSADDDPAAVVQGFAPETDWRMLLEACVAVRAGVRWVATNVDLTIPTPRGTAPGNGALVDVVRRTTGAEPVVTGKPWRPIMDEAARRTGATRALVVGDRLDTDIAGAVNAGLPSLLVLTGVSRVRDLVAAPEGLRPTYVAADLDGLGGAHPGCGPDADGWWRCGRVAARVRAGVVEVDRPVPSAVSVDEGLEALRAVCAAVWHSADDPASDTGVSGAVDVQGAVEALSPWTAPHGWDR